MNARDYRSLVAYVSVVDFVKSRKLDGGRMGTARRTLEGSIAHIRAASIVQDGAHDGATRDSVLRRDLRGEIRQEYMIPLGRDARAYFRDEPKLAAACRVPHANENDEAVVAAAELMIATLKPHVAHFVDVGHKKGFLTALEKATKRLKKWVVHTAETGRRRVVANRELEAHFTQARDAVRVIDGLMLGVGRKNPGLLGEWKTAKRIPKKRGRPRVVKGASRGVKTESPE